MPTLPTLHDIRKAHRWKRDYERYLPVSRFFFRPAGFLVTWLAIRIGFTSEAVSWLSGVVGLAGCFCLICGQGIWLPVGIALLFVFNLLDCVDGSIARSMKTENPYGRFLDSICGGVIDLIFWAVIGIMAFRNQEYLLFKHVQPMYGGFLWLIIGSVTCFLSVLLGFLEQTFDSLIRPAWEKVHVPKYALPSSHSNNQSTSHDMLSKVKIIRIINHNLRVRETHYVLFLFAFLGRFMDLLLVLFFIYYLLNNIFLMIIYSVRGIKVRNSYTKDQL